MEVGITRSDRARRGHGGRWALLGLGVAAAASAGHVWEDEQRWDSPAQNVTEAFGGAVAVSGAAGLVGAASNDDTTVNAGAAYVIDLVSGAMQVLLASDGQALDGFGGSVAAAGAYLAVGASGAGPVGTDEGAVYVFGAGTLAELHRLQPASRGAADAFGTSVDVLGGEVLVGAPGHGDVGAAFLFDASSGMELRELTSLDGLAGDELGSSVALGAEVAVVGAPLHAATGPASGSAYVFERATGIQRQELVGDDTRPGDWFGHAVAVSGRVAVVGAPFALAPSTPNWVASGAAYVFDTETGVQLLKLTSDDADNGDAFGWSVAVDGSVVLVGANRTADQGPLTGSVYAFDLATGVQTAKLVSADASAQDNFGSSVALDAGNALIGAPRAEGWGILSGAAYSFRTHVPVDTGLPTETGSTAGHTGDTGSTGPSDTSAGPTDTGDGGPGPTDTGSTDTDPLGNNPAPPAGADAGGCGCATAPPPLGWGAVWVRRRVR